MEPRSGSHTKIQEVKESKDIKSEIRKTNLQSAVTSAAMMSQYAALSSLFDDDSLLWPLQHETLSSLQQDFFSQKSRLTDSLLKELNNGPQLLPLRQFPVISSMLARLNDDRDQKRDVSTKPHEDIQQVTDKNKDLLVTLDARGYAPGDITVKLEGRSLVIMATKQAGEEERQSCSTSSSSASFSSSASSKMGFMQKVDLPAHLDLSGLSCSLMDDGQLRIHAPVAKPPMSKEDETPIRYRTSLEFPIKKDNEEHED